MDVSEINVYKYTQTIRLSLRELMTSLAFVYNIYANNIFMYVAVN